MNRSISNSVWTLLAILVFAGLGVKAQEPSPTPTLTKPTVISRPVTDAEDSKASDTLLAPDVEKSRTDTERPGLDSILYSSEGVLIETPEGKTVLSQYADVGYNPASAVKLATALAALKTFGPAYRFDTAVWTNGTFDRQTGTITGDLIISGRDPSFHYEHAIDIAQELNRLGVRTVTGDLIVPPKFTMNFDYASLRSGEQFYDTLDSTRRSGAAMTAWLSEQSILSPGTPPAAVPSVAVMGAVYVDSVPKDAKLLLVHRSSKIVDVLKVLLCYSNNFMAERIGDVLGGPDGVRRVAITEAGVNASDINLASTSGLGVNRVTPRAMMKIYRTLTAVLAKNNLTVADILPVAGIDPGTLQKRYSNSLARGSVIAKTGTLTHTDGGVSALVGQMRASNGEVLYFVIFNRGTGIVRARSHQDQIVSLALGLRGGPSPFAYQPGTLAMRLADTEMNATAARSGEFEPTGNQ